MHTAQRRGFAAPGRVAGLFMVAVLSGCGKAGPDRATRPCTADADCYRGELCAAGVCVQKNRRCSASSPCPDGLECCGGTCRRGRCCTLDMECPEGHCRDGLCADTPRPNCGPDTPCPSGRCLLTLAEPKCVECIVSSDCPEGENICSAEHQCIPTSVAGCTPEECAAKGQICAPQYGCRDCAARDECGDRACVNGRCQPCSSNAQCGSASECSENGRCVAEASTPCVTNADCGDRVCIQFGDARQCAACSLNAECGNGQSCHVASGRCRSASPSCQSDADCTPPQTVCAGGSCAAGCSETGCATGQVCNPSTGRCTQLSSGSKALGEACNRHSECASAVCWPLQDGSESLALCSKACMRHTDCPEPFTCVHIGQGSLCLPQQRLAPGSYSVPPGGSCGSQFLDRSCATQWCDPQAQTCYETCRHDTACPEGRCVTYRREDDAVAFVQVCDAPAGPRPAGSACTADGQCASGFCAQTPDTTIGPRCAQPCCTPADCRPDNPICKPVDFYDGVYDPQAGTPFGFQSVCLWREHNGTKALGEPCSSNAECRSELCVQGLSGERRCTRTCCTHADCASLSWSGGCRPPFTDPQAPLDQLDHPDSGFDLGRWFVGDGIYPTWASTTVCMPE